MARHARWRAQGVDVQAACRLDRRDGRVEGRGHARAANTTPPAARDAQVGRDRKLAANDWKRAALTRRIAPPRRPQLRAARKAHVARAGSARSKRCGRATASSTRRAARLRHALSAARAPVVLEIGFGMGETTAAIARCPPRHRLHRRRGPRPRRRRLACAARRGVPRQRARRASRCRRGRGRHDRAGFACRRARVLSRPVAQEAPSQAATPATGVRACARGAAAPGGCFHAATDWEDTPTRCLSRSRPSLCCAIRRRASRRGPRRGRSPVRGARPEARPRRLRSAIPQSVKDGRPPEVGRARHRSEFQAALRPDAAPACAKAMRRVIAVRATSREKCARMFSRPPAASRSHSASS